MDVFEEWRDVEGFEGIYQVSNKGRVRSLDRYVYNHRQKGKVLKPRPKPSTKYLQVGLSDKSHGKKEKHAYVHILVARAFIPNPRGCKQVNHKDFDKSNNCVENLEWVTDLENKQHYRQSEYAKKIEEKRINKLHSKCFERIIKYKKK